MPRTATARKPAAVASQRTPALAEPGVSRKQATHLFTLVAKGAQLSPTAVRSNIIPDSSWKRAGATLPPSAAQSTLRLERVLKLGEAIWGDKTTASAWLNTPHPELSGATPFSLLRTEAGGRAVEDLLIALEHGFPV